MDLQISIFLLCLFSSVEDHCDACYQLILLIFILTMNLPFNSFTVHINCHLLGTAD